MTSFNAFNGLLDVPNPGISLLQEGCLEEVVLLFGRSDLKHKLKTKRYPVRNDSFQRAEVQPHSGSAWPTETQMPGVECGGGEQDRAREHIHIVGDAQA